MEAGVADEWEREGLIDVKALSFDLEKRSTIMEKFSELVRTRTSSWWDETATRIETPVSMVRTPSEWIATARRSSPGRW